MEGRYLPDTVYGRKVSGGGVFIACVTAIQGHAGYERIINWYLWTLCKNTKGLLHISGFCRLIDVRREKHGRTFLPVNITDRGGHTWQIRMDTPG
jgi:hypothetical protein